MVACTEVKKVPGRMKKQPRSSKIKRSKDVMQRANSHKDKVHAQMWPEKRKDLGMSNTFPSKNKSR